MIFNGDVGFFFFLTNVYFLFYLRITFLSQNSLNLRFHEIGVDLILLGNQYTAQIGSFRSLPFEISSRNPVSPALESPGPNPVWWISYSAWKQDILGRPQSWKIPQAHVSRETPLSPPVPFTVAVPCVSIHASEDFGIRFFGVTPVSVIHAGWLYTISFTSLGLNFLNYEMGIMYPSFRIKVKNKWNNECETY